MLPVLLRIAWHGVTLRFGSYAVLIFCGVLVATLIVLRRAREVRLSPRDLLPVFTAAIIAGFAGARFAFWLQCGGTPFRGGLVLYGGLIAGLLTGLAAAKATGIPVLRVADLAAPLLLLATAFGRVGCTLAGCCYGVVATHGVVYPPGSHAYRDQLGHGLIPAGAAESLPTVPIALLEAGVLFLLFAITSMLWRRRLRPGVVLGASAILYPAWRFVAEFWRADNDPYWIGGLTFSQGISILCLAAAATMLCRRSGGTTTVAPAYRPASVLQVLLLLACVSLSLGGVSCGSHQNHGESHGSQDLSNYRKPDPAKPAPQNGQPRTKSKKENDDDDFFSDCIADCMADCTEDCIDACVDAACSGSCKGSGEEDPVHEAVASPLATLEPGQKYRGTLNVEAVVNKQWSVVIRLKGQMTAGKAGAGGVRPVHLGLRGIDIVAGDLHWRGSGDLNLDVSRDLRFRIVDSTLPPEILDALYDLEAVLGNFMGGAPSGRPPSDLSKRIQAELSVPSPQAEFSLSTSFDGRERWLLGEGKVVEDPSGTPRLNWTLRY